MLSISISSIFSLVDALSVLLDVFVSEKEKILLLNRLEYLIKDQMYILFEEKNTELPKMSKYTERTARNRIQAIRKLGCKCQMCGFQARMEIQLAIFDIHHIKANNGSERTRDVLKNICEGNTENYMLLCANCHKIANILDGTAKGTWTNSIKENVSDLFA